jgi:hypothetical protein
MSNPYYIHTPIDYLYPTGIRHPEAEILVYTDDTDVLVLMVGHHASLPTRTTLIMKSGVIPLHDIVSSLGPRHIEALIGFHAFTGCDVVGMHCSLLFDADAYIFSICDL